MRKVENKIIEIKEETQIGNIILEKGDKVEVLKEGWETEFYQSAEEMLSKLFSKGTRPSSIGSTIGAIISGSLGSLKMNDRISNDMAYEVLIALEEEIQLQKNSFNRI